MLLEPPRRQLRPRAMISNTEKEGIVQQHYRGQDASSALPLLLLLLLLSVERGVRSDGSKNGEWVEQGMLVGVLGSAAGFARKLLNFGRTASERMAGVVTDGTTMVVEEQKGLRKIFVKPTGVLLVYWSSAVSNHRRDRV